MAASSSSSSGIGFCGLFTIVLAVLKLLGKISISWVWVFAPMWIGALVGITIIIAAFIIVGLLSLSK